jgi:hypothetical protein
MVCRRRRLQAKEYALLLSDMSILIPLDRTVASLQGKSDLRLVKRTMLPHMGVDVRPIGRSTDPNGASLPHFLCHHCARASFLTIAFCPRRKRRSSSVCLMCQTWTITPRKISRPRTRLASRPDFSFFFFLDWQLFFSPSSTFFLSSDPSFSLDLQKYTVYRKMPMIVGKHERTLAIDGPYIHVRIIQTRHFSRAT